MSHTQLAQTRRPRRDLEWRSGWMPALDCMSSRRIVFLSAFVVTFIGFLVIPFSVMYGRLDKSWMSISNAIFYLGCAIMVLGALSAVLWTLNRIPESFAERASSEATTAAP